MEAPKAALTWGWVWGGVSPPQWGWSLGRDPSPMGVEPEEGDSPLPSQKNFSMFFEMGHFDAFWSTF